MNNMTYENQGTNTFLVYAMSDGEVLDTTSVGMITNNHIPGLLGAVFTQTDNRRFIKYNVTAKIPVSQMLVGMVNKRRIMGILNGLVGAFLSADEFMIDQRTIVLDPDYMFSDVTTCETYMICVPTVDETRTYPDIPGFIKRIMFTSQFDESESNDYVTKIINYLNSASSAFSLYRFNEILTEISSGAPNPGYQPIPALGRQTGEPMPSRAQQTGGANVPNNVPNNMGGGMPNNMGGGMPNNMGGGMPNNMGGGMPNNMGGGMPNNMGGGMPNNMGDDLLNNMGGGMPNNMGDVVLNNMNMGGNQPPRMATPPRPAPPQMPPQPPVPPQKPQKQNSNPGVGFAVPGRDGPNQNIPRMNGGGAAQANSGEKMSFMYLLQHYNKENAALYKAQKNQGKAPMQQMPPQQMPPQQMPPMPPQQKPSKKQKGAPQFAVPGQNMPGQNMPNMPNMPGNMPGGMPNMPGNMPGGMPNMPNNMGGGMPNNIPNMPNMPGNIPNMPNNMGGSMPNMPGGAPAAPNMSGAQQRFGQPAPAARQGGFDDDFGDTVYMGGGDDSDTVIMGMESSAQQLMPHLLRRSNGERIPIDKSYFRIGRDADFNDYAVVDNKHVGHSHCHIFTNNGEYFIVDDNSKNHTMVNGTAIPSGQNVKLAHGFVVTLADEVFEFRLY